MFRASSCRSAVDGSGYCQLVIIDLVGEVAYVDVSGLTVAGRHFEGPHVMMQGTIMSHDEIKGTVLVELSIESRTELVVPIERVHQPTLRKPDVDLTATVESVVYSERR
jgi:hypothetical protein